MTLNKKEKWAIALIVLASIINFIFVAILIFALSKARWLIKMNGAGFLIRFALIIL